MKTRHIWLLAGLLMLSCASAWAQDTGKTTLYENGTPVTVTSEEPDSIQGDYQIDFATLDRNHDGFISREEAKANPTLSAEFKALDTHHTGRLTKAQLEGWLKK